jgi:pseudo-rSAM protein
MINAEVKTKFYLAPHVYYARREQGSFILYNTKTGEHIESSSIICRNIIDRIYEPVNLGMIDVNDIDFNENEIHSFLEEIEVKKFGKIIEHKDDAPQYINLLPILNLQRDVERLKTDKAFSIGEDLVNYLHEINIYINSICNLECPNCNLYYKQVKSCRKELQGKYLDISIIKKVLDGLSYSQLYRINILGGNVFLYPYFSELLDLIHNYNFDFHVWSHYANFIDLKTTTNNFSIDVIVTFPIKDNLWNLYTSLFKDKQVQYHFYITNEKDYENTEMLIEKFKISNYSIHPVYIQTNYNFFEENVYLTKEDILENIISFRNIFCNQKLNSNYFGKLYILPDGSIKATMNSLVLGNIKNNSLLEIIYNELDNNTAWRKTRDMKPCNQCLYQYLCPPPSNYETVIGRPNLCYIKP